MGQPRRKMFDPIKKAVRLVEKYGHKAAIEIACDRKIQTFLKPISNWEKITKFWLQVEIILIGDDKA
jgi:hypothetical protein